MNYIDYRRKYKIYSVQESNYCGGKTVTLIVAMKTSESIIMACDSRANIGSFGEYNDNQQKISKFEPFLLGIAGMGEVGRTLLAINNETLRKNTDSIDNFAIWMAQCFSSTYAKWYENATADQKPFIQFILAGFRDTQEINNKPVIYSLKSINQFVPELSGNNPVFGGYGQYASYLCNKYYKPSISSQLAQKLAVYLITETSTTLIHVGGKINVVEMMPGGPFKELDEKEIEKIIANNNQFNKKIITFFEDR